jgi:hypothetical protein
MYYGNQQVVYVEPVSVQPGYYQQNGYQYQQAPYQQQQQQQGVYQQQQPYNGYPGNSANVAYAQPVPQGQGYYQ